MSKYICQICGFTYDEDKGMPDKGISPGTKWDDLPSDWVCPLCGAEKQMFSKDESNNQINTQNNSINHPLPEKEEKLRAISFGELAAICSNLARGCEKQYLSQEKELFQDLAQYFANRINIPIEASYAKFEESLDLDIASLLPTAFEQANEYADRGAKRVLTWCEKVTKTTRALLERFEKTNGEILENTKIWVCDICGFVYIGQTPPDICPICKVPSSKILEVK